MNLKCQKKALLMKFLHKFFNRLPIPWVTLTWQFYYNTSKVPHLRRPVGSFWWKDVSSLKELFRSIARCQVGDGRSVSFWMDMWDLGVPMLTFPQLFASVRDRKVSVLNFYTNPTDRNFALPLSLVASGQWNQLDNMLDSILLSELTPDQWTYVWGNNTFSSKQAYKTIAGIREAPWPFTWLWKASCREHHKFFFWLLLLDRLNTRNIMRRKNQHLDSYDCVLSNTSTEETLEHLFFSCHFSQWCWRFVNLQWPNITGVLDRVEEAK